MHNNSHYNTKKRQDLKFKQLLSRLKKNSKTIFCDKTISKMIVVSFVLRRSR